VVKLAGNGLEETLALEPRLAEEPGLVAVGAIADNCGHSFARPEDLGHLVGSHHIEGGRGADEESLLVQEAEDHLYCLCVWDVEGVVKEFERGFQVLSNAALANSLRDGADTLSFQLAQLDVIVEHRAWRVGQEDLDLRVDLLQEGGSPTEGTSCARGAGKAVDLALRLGPDLGAGGLNVGLHVGNIVELVCPHRIRDRLGEGLSLVIIIGGVGEGHSRNGPHISTWPPLFTKSKFLFLFLFFYVNIF